MGRFLWLTHQMQPKAQALAALVILDRRSQRVVVFILKKNNGHNLENTCKIIKSRMAILDVAGEAEVEKYPKNSPKKTCF